MADLTYESILDWKVPTGTLPCWIIDERDRLTSIKEMKPFYNYQPSCYFKIMERLDNNFLRGCLGHNSFSGKFHSEILSHYTYFQDYQNRQPVYLSFDRVTLYRLVEIIPTKPLSFILRRIDEPKAIKQGKAFMIMPFRFDALNNFYQEHIKAFLSKEMKIEILRADDFNDNDIIIDTIYKQIEESEFVIADTSYANKNVFYEFGYGSAKEKEIIAIQNKDIEETLFFDRVHIRAILYSMENIPDFHKQLRNTITAIRSRVAFKN